MIALTLTSALITLGACGVAAWYRSAFLEGMAMCRRYRTYLAGETAENTKWRHMAKALEAEKAIAKARRSRAASIARQAQLDRAAALRDNATAALREGRAI